MFNRFKTPHNKMTNPDSPKCLLFSHAHERLEDPLIFKAFAAVLGQAIELMPQMQWIIRLHPGEDDSFYQELGLVGHPRVQIQPRRISLEEAVAEADVTCTIRSTAGLQAMMMQRPLLIIDLVTNAECSVWWPLHGGGLAAKTPQDFKMHCSRLVEDPTFRASVLNLQREFLDRTFANKGRAAAGVVDYLAEKTPSNPTAPLSAQGKFGKKFQPEEIRL